MTAHPTRAVAWSAAALSVTAATLAGLGSGLGGTERMVAQGFTAAIETRSAAPADSSRAALVQLSGSEEFWLNSARPAPGTVPVGWGGPLAVGDQVTITAAGRERKLSVVDIRPIGDGSIADRASAGAPLLLVTCEDPLLPEARPVRFVIEREPTVDLGGRAPHSL